MRRNICAVLAFSFLAAVMCGCMDSGEAEWDKAQSNYEESESVWMETQYSVYQPGVKTVLAKWFNSGTGQLTGGEEFSIEKLVGNTWRVVKKGKNTDYSFNDISYPLYAGGSYWQSYDLTPFTDGLDIGKYRICTYVADQSLEYIQVYGYFEVGETAQLRKVTSDQGFFDYVDSYFGFAAVLPDSWAGCTTVVKTGTGDQALDRLAGAIDENWMAVCIRHPDYNNGVLTQDINFACVSLEAWNSAENPGGPVNSDFRPLPDRIATDRWMLLFAKNTLDASLVGCSDAAQVYDTIQPIL